MVFTKERLTRRCLGRTCALVGRWLQGGLAALQTLRDPRLPRGRAEKGPGEEALIVPGAHPGTQSSFPPRSPGCRGRHPARGRQAPGPNTIPASLCGVGPRCDPEALRKRFRSQRRQDGGGHAGEAGGARPTRPVTGRGGRRSGRTASAASLGGRGPAAAEGAVQGPLWAGPSRTRLRPGSRPGWRGPAGARNQGLRPRRLEPVGPSPVPELPKFLFQGVSAPFLRSPPAVSPGQRQLPLKLCVQQIFLKHLLCAGIYSIFFGFIQI